MGLGVFSDKIPINHKAKEYSVEKRARDDEDRFTPPHTSCEALSSIPSPTKVMQALQGLFAGSEGNKISRRGHASMLPFFKQEKS